MQRYQEIERSIITTYRSKIWARFIQGIKEFELLKENDHVCVCISGGKDSFLLAKCFQELQRHSDFQFKVSYMVMDPGYEQQHKDKIIKNLEILNIPATIVQSDIFEITDKMTDNPCFLCARMRRGVLYKNAKALGCNKIALGHHFNDVIETTLMSLFYAGKVQTMMPKLHSDNYEGMELIRPLYYVHEEDIIKFVGHNNLEFINCACRVTKRDGHVDSKRLEIKNLIEELKKKYSLIDQNIFMGTQNVNLDTIVAYSKGKTKHSFLDEYEKKDGKE